MQSVMSRFSVGFHPLYAPRRYRLPPAVAFPPTKRIRSPVEEARPRACRDHRYFQDSSPTLRSPKVTLVPLHRVLCPSHPSEISDCQPRQPAQRVCRIGLPFGRQCEVPCHFASWRVAAARGMALFDLPQFSFPRRRWRFHPPKFFVTAVSLLSRRAPPGRLTLLRWRQVPHGFLPMRPVQPPEGPGSVLRDARAVTPRTAAGVQP